MQHMQILTTILKPYHTFKTVLQLTSSPCAIGLGAPCVSLPVYFYGHRREPGQRPACTHARACTGWTSYWKGLRMEPSKSRLAVEQYGDTSPIAGFSSIEACDEKCLQHRLYIRSLIITRRRIEPKTLPPESWHPGRDTQRCYSPIATLQMAEFYYPVTSAAIQVTVLGEVIAVSPGDGLMSHPKCFLNRMISPLPVETSSDRSPNLNPSTSSTLHNILTEGDSNQRRCIAWAESLKLLLKFHISRTESWLPIDWRAEERQHKRRSKPIDNLFFKGCEQRQILPGVMALHLRHDRSSSTAPVQKASSKQKHSENPTESWHYIARADWVWSNLIMEIKTRGCTMEIYGKEYCRQLMSCTIIID